MTIFDYFLEGDFGPQTGNSVTIDGIWQGREGDLGVRLGQFGRVSIEGISDGETCVNYFLDYGRRCQIQIRVSTLFPVALVFIGRNLSRLDVPGARGYEVGEMLRGEGLTLLSESFLSSSTQYYSWIERRMFDYHEILFDQDMQYPVKPRSSGRKGRGA